MRPSFSLAILALLGALAAWPAVAQPPREPGVLPLDRILPGIRRTHPGEFYDADGPTPAPDGSEHYHLKWMTPEGRIEWLDADARTGRVLGASPGRDAFDGPGPPAYFAPAPSYPMPYGFVERGGPRMPIYGGAGPWRGGGGGGYGGGRGRRRGR
jgi:hypothetical protein